MLHAQYKVVLLGDSGTGKTSLVKRVSAGASGTAETISTLSTVGVDLAVISRGKHVKLQCWDTAGQEKYRSIAESFYRGADGVMLVYDVTRAASFEGVATWLQGISAHDGGARAAAIVLVGNKADLPAARQVTAAGGAAAAAQLGAGFFETSALTGASVDAAFDDLAARVAARAAAAAAAAAAAGAPAPARGFVPVDFASLAAREEAAAAAADGARCAC